jgi:hypothetical protein
MGLGIAEIDQQPILKILGNMAGKLLDGRGGSGFPRVVTSTYPIEILRLIA